MFLSMMMLSTAMAGKLSEGFRGLPYGPATALEAPPGEGCAPNPEPSVRWMCPMQIGEAIVTVAYMAQENLFYGVFISASGYINCTTLFDVLLAGYGSGVPESKYDDSRLAKRFWRDGSVVGVWDFNKYSDKATFGAFDQTLMDKIKAADAVRAKAGASGL